MDESETLTHENKRREQTTAYKRLLRFITWFGILLFVGGGLWLVAGAGIYGSPVGDAFRGNGDNWAMGMLFAVLLGPMAVLPCALIERYRAKWGAFAMIVAGALVAEFGIRTGRDYMGFADVGALIVIGCFGIPIFMLGGWLAVLAESERRSRMLCAVLIVMGLLSIGISLRYSRVKSFWNANSPRQMEILLREQRVAIRVLNWEQAELKRRSDVLIETAAAVQRKAGLEQLGQHFGVILPRTPRPHPDWERADMMSKDVVMDDEIYIDQFRISVDQLNKAIAEKDDRRVQEMTWFLRDQFETQEARVTEAQTAVDQLASKIDSITRLHRRSAAGPN